MRELPSKFSPPIVGDTPAFLKDPALLLSERRRELGPVFKISVLNEAVACFVGPKAFAHFLDEKYFQRASASPPHLQEILDQDAVPFKDGEGFSKRKELLMQVFSRDALEGYAPTLERVVRRFLRKWVERGSFQWVPELTAMGMTIAGALYVGADPDQEDPALAEMFDEAFAGILSLPVNLPFTAYGKALKARDTLRVRLDAAVAAHAAAPKDDAMSRLLSAKTKNGEMLTPLEARIETIHFFGAYVPLIGALSYLASFLGEHKDVREKLRAEILDKAPTGAVSPSSLRELPYLDAVCKESRRAQPILPVTFFAKSKLDHDFDGVAIPAGIKAIGVIAGTLMDPDAFPEPSKFDPDRWLAPRVSERQSMAWVPHGGGAHLLGHRCAGEQLADLMLKMFAVLTLREFTWEQPPQDLAPAKGKLFATPKDGLTVKFTRAPR